MEFHCQARCHHRPQGQCRQYGLNLQLDNGGGNSHTGSPVDCLEKWQSTTKGEKRNEKPRLACVNVRHSPSKSAVGVPPWTCRSEGKWPSRETVGRGMVHKWLASLNIWCWGAWDITRGHHTNAGMLRASHHRRDRLEERFVERGSAWRFFLKEREGHRQSDEHWNCFKGNVLGKLLRDGHECIWEFPGA